MAIRRSHAARGEEFKVTEPLIFLALLTFVSLPFAGISAAAPRMWTIAIPVVVWILVLALQNQGLIPGETHLGTALFAAGYGVAFAWAGILIGRRNPSATA
jgi:hypothetical protein